MQASPIPYVRDAKLSGSVFDSVDSSDANRKGLLSGVDTDFFVDHDEPLAALADVQQDGEVEWPFGDLPDGHEFLLICEDKRRRSRSVS